VVTGANPHFTLPIFFTARSAALPVYCDVSLRAFDEVVPAAGSIHSPVRAIADG
jgi:prolyl-tRNA editing enzyme YbaK/EbsC (Cys-tRNA(Pro) deacylase)